MVEEEIIKFATIYKFQQPCINNFMLIIKLDLVTRILFYTTKINSLIAWSIYLHSKPIHG